MNTNFKPSKSKMTIVPLFGGAFVYAFFLGECGHKTNQFEKKSGQNDETENTNKCLIFKSHLMYW